MAGFEDAGNLEEAAASIQGELDQLARQAASLTPKAADDVAQRAIEAIARCVALRNRVVSLDALVRTKQLEQHAQAILERCRAARARK